MPKDPTGHPEENRLTRWSRRKAQAAAGHAPVVAGGARPPDAHPGPQTDDNAAPDASSPRKILTDADMPPIDSLTEDSDFSGFLSPGVSEGLRKQALRKLFASPGFNIRDGLDDYDDDFRTFAALGDLVTCDMKHQMELQAERERKAREQAPEAGAATDRQPDPEPPARGTAATPPARPADPGEGGDRRPGDDNPRDEPAHTDRPRNRRAHQKTP